ncbi:cobalamin-binding protein [Alteribacter natronophilus]|uniref:cobalamin-binding protein n=1 Tax=Alteribacter natronophilus TaxID=2583810 RepID=UPI00110DDD3E|nr:cobalamin-binding protein [Alteribacter natronophilus]TMW73440.1 cobalamin-binding protein [Alteribacter natronophilus]
MKLISICPSSTEFLAYLGLTDSIVAVDDFSDWPEGIKTLPRLGPDLSIDMDRLEAYKPDLVLASLSVPGMEKNVRALEERRIPHIVVPDPENLAGISGIIRFVAGKTGVSQKGDLLAEAYDNTLSQYKEISRSIASKKSIYWEWWPKPVFTPGRKNWLTELSEVAGGRNVFAEKDVKSVQTDWETVRNYNPDIIALVWTGVRQERINLKTVERRPGWGGMKALRNNQIHVLDEPLYCRPSPRLLEGLVKLSAILHPDAYPLYTGEDPLLYSCRG